MNHPIEGMLNVSMDKIKEMVDVNRVIGEPIQSPDDLTTIIPVSKVSFGFGSGGSDLPIAKERENFGGGIGAGATIKPVAFLLISNGDVELIQLNSSANGLFENASNAFFKVLNFFKKKKNKRSNRNDFKKNNKMFK